MDPLTQLYQRLRAHVPGPRIPIEPPAIEEWLEYWNDDDTDIGNLRAFEHWLSRNGDIPHFAAVVRRNASSPK